MLLSSQHISLLSKKGAGSFLPSILLSFPLPPSCLFCPCLFPWWLSVWVVRLTALTPDAWDDVNSLRISISLLLWQSSLLQLMWVCAPGEARWGKGGRRVGDGGDAWLPTAVCWWAGQWCNSSSLICYSTVCIAAALWLWVGMYFTPPHAYISYRLVWASSSFTVERVSQWSLRCSIKPCYHSHTMESLGTFTAAPSRAS